jgi:dynein heavy chain
VQAVVALITADVHNRDVVGTLVQKGISSTSDFSWQQQLRFEYDPDADSILVRQVNARYLGSLVVRGMC